MKKNILYIFLITNSLVLAQPFEFEKIIVTDSLETKDILFNRLSSRLIEYIGGQDKYEKNIIHSDKELGVIKFKQLLAYKKGLRSDDGFVDYNVNVYFKDGRFKIVLSDFIHRGKGISLNKVTYDEEYPHKQSDFLKFRKKAWKELKSYIELEVPAIILSIEMLIQTPTEIENDW